LKTRKIVKFFHTTNVFEKKRDKTKNAGVQV